MAGWGSRAQDDRANKTANRIASNGMEEKGTLKGKLFSLTRDGTMNLVLLHPLFNIYNARSGVLLSIRLGPGRPVHEGCFAYLIYLLSL